MRNPARVAAALLLLPLAATAQQWEAPDRAAQVEAMEAIAFLLGDSGDEFCLLSGWI